MELQGKKVCWMRGRWVKYVGIILMSKLVNLLWWKSLSCLGMGATWKNLWCGKWLLLTTFMIFLNLEMNRQQSIWSCFKTTKTTSNGSDLQIIFIEDKKASVGWLFCSSFAVLDILGLLYMVLFIQTFFDKPIVLLKWFFKKYWFILQEFHMQNEVRKGIIVF